MKIDRNKLKAPVTLLKPEFNKLIENLKSANDFELIQGLKTPNFWNYDKIELYYWVDVLDKFDYILEKASSKPKESTWLIHCDLPENELEKELVIIILNFTTKLIEHTVSKNIYNSIDNLISLLNSSDISIIIAVLDLLYAFSKRSSYLNKLPVAQKTALFQPLLHLAQTWGGKANGLSLAQCSRDLSMNEFPSSCTSLHFEFYPLNKVTLNNTLDKSKDDNKAKPNSKEAVNPNSLITIHVDNVDKLIGKYPIPSHVMHDLFKRFDIPDDQKIQLFSQIRLAYHFSDYNERVLCVRARLKAISILMYTKMFKEKMDTFIYPGLVEEICEILALSETPDYLETKTAAVKALTSLVSIHDLASNNNVMLNSIIEHTQLASHTGLLPHIIKNFIERDIKRLNHFTSKNADVDNEKSQLLMYGISLFSFLYHLAEMTEDSDIFVSSGLLKDLLKVVSDFKEDPNQIMFETRAVRIMDMISSIDMHAFFNENGPKVLLARFQKETDICLRQVPYIIAHPCPLANKLTRKPDQLNTGPSRSPNYSLSSTSDNEIETLEERNREKNEEGTKMEEKNEDDEDEEGEGLEGRRNANGKESKPPRYYLREDSESNPCALATSLNIPDKSIRCFPPRAALMKSILNLLKNIVSEPVHINQYARQMMNSNFISCLKHVISNVDYYGASLFLLALDLVSNYIFSEPSELFSIQKTGMTDLMLKALLEKEFPSTREIMTSLPTIFTSLCLNHRGMRAFLAKEPFDKLFKILISPKYLSALKLSPKQLKRRRRMLSRADPPNASSFTEPAQDFGAMIDELLRHQPTLKQDAMASICKVIAELVAMGKSHQFELKSTPVSKPAPTNTTSTALTTTLTTTSNSNLPTNNTTPPTSQDRILNPTTSEISQPDNLNIFPYGRALSVSPARSTSSLTSSSISSHDSCHSNSDLEDNLDNLGGPEPVITENRNVEEIQREDQRDLEGIEGGMERMNETSGVRTGLGGMETLFEERSRITASENIVDINDGSMDTNHDNMEPGKKHSKSGSHHQETSHFLDFTYNVLKFLEAIISNGFSSDHCQAFINKGGGDLLLQLVSLPVLPFDFIHTKAFNAFVSVYKWVVTYSHYPTILNMCSKTLYERMESLRFDNEEFWPHSTIYGLIQNTEQKPVRMGGYGLYPLNPWVFGQLSHIVTLVYLLKSVNKLPKLEVKKSIAHYWTSNVGKPLILTLNHFALRLFHENQKYLACPNHPDPPSDRDIKIFSGLSSTLNDSLLSLTSGLMEVCSSSCFYNAPSNTAPVSSNRTNLASSRPENSLSQSANLQNRQITTSANENSAMANPTTTTSTAISSASNRRAIYNPPRPYMPSTSQGLDSILTSSAGLPNPTLYSVINTAAMCVTLNYRIVLKLYNTGVLRPKSRCVPYFLQFLRQMCRILLNDKKVANKMTLQKFVASKTLAYFFASLQLVILDDDKDDKNSPPAINSKDIQCFLDFWVLITTPHTLMEPSLRLIPGMPDLSTNERSKLVSQLEHCKFASYVYSNTLKVLGLWLDKIGATESPALLDPLSVQAICSIVINTISGSRSIQNKLEMFAKLKSKNLVISNNSANSSALTASKNIATTNSNLPSSEIVGTGTDQGLVAGSEGIPTVSADQPLPPTANNTNNATPASSRALYSRLSRGAHNIDEYSRRVESLVDMGFARPRVVEALRHCSTLEHATEYLLSLSAADIEAFREEEEIGGATDVVPIIEENPTPISEGHNADTNTNLVVDVPLSSLIIAPRDLNTTHSQDNEATIASNEDTTMRDIFNSLEQTEVAIQRATEIATAITRGQTISTAAQNAYNTPLDNNALIDTNRNNANITNAENNSLEMELLRRLSEVDTSYRDLGLGSSEEIIKTPQNETLTMETNVLERMELELDPDIQDIPLVDLASLTEGENASGIVQSPISRDVTQFLSRYFFRQILDGISRSLAISLFGKLLASCKMSQDSGCVSALAYMYLACGRAEGVGVYTSSSIIKDLIETLGHSINTFDFGKSDATLESENPVISLLFQILTLIFEELTNDELSLIDFSSLCRLLTRFLEKSLSLHRENPREISPTKNRDNDDVNNVLNRDWFLPCLTLLDSSARCQVRLGWVSFLYFPTTASHIITQKANLNPEEIQTTGFSDSGGHQIAKDAGKGIKDDNQNANSAMNLPSNSVITPIINVLQPKAIVGSSTRASNPATSLVTARSWRWLDERTGFWNPYPSSLVHLIDSSFDSGQDQSKYSCTINPVKNSGSAKRFNATGFTGPASLYFWSMSQRLITGSNDSKDNQDDHQSRAGQLRAVEMSFEGFRKELLSEKEDANMDVDTQAETNEEKKLNSTPHGLPLDPEPCNGLPQDLAFQILKLCVEVMQTRASFICPEVLECLLMLCVRFTRDTPSCLYFMDINGPVVTLKAVSYLLNQKETKWDPNKYRKKSMVLLYKDIRKLVNFLFRHLFEDETNLKLVMDKVVQNVYQSSPAPRHATDVSNIKTQSTTRDFNCLIRILVPALWRNHKVFYHSMVNSMEFMPQAFNKNDFPEISHKSSLFVKLLPPSYPPALQLPSDDKEKLHDAAATQAINERTTAILFYLIHKLKINHQFHHLNDETIEGGAFVKDAYTYYKSQSNILILLTELSLAYPHVSSYLIEHCYETSPPHMSMPFPKDWRDDLSGHSFISFLLQHLLPLDYYHYTARLLKSRTNLDARNADKCRELRASKSSASELYGYLRVLLLSLTVSGFSRNFQTPKGKETRESLVYEYQSAISATNNIQPPSYKQHHHSTGLFSPNASNYTLNEHSTIDAKISRDLISILVESFSLVTKFTAGSPNSLYIGGIMNLNGSNYHHQKLCALLSQLNTNDSSNQITNPNTPSSSSLQPHGSLVKSAFKHGLLKQLAMVPRRVRMEDPEFPAIVNSTLLTMETFIRLVNAMPLNQPQKPMVHTAGTQAKLPAPNASTNTDRPPRSTTNSDAAGMGTNDGGNIDAFSGLPLPPPQTDSHDDANRPPRNTSTNNGRTPRRSRRPRSRDHHDPTGPNSSEYISQRNIRLRSSTNNGADVPLENDSVMIFENQGLRGDNDLLPAQAPELEEIIVDISRQPGPNISIRQDEEMENYRDNMREMLDQEDIGHEEQQEGIHRTHGTEEHDLTGNTNEDDELDEEEDEEVDELDEEEEEEEDDEEDEDEEDDMEEQEMEEEDGSDPDNETEPEQDFIASDTGLVSAPYWRPSTGSGSNGARRGDLGGLRHSRRTGMNISSFGRARREAFRVTGRRGRNRRTATRRNNTGNGVERNEEEENEAYYDLDYLLTRARDGAERSDNLSNMMDLNLLQSLLDADFDLTFFPNSRAESSSITGFLGPFNTTNFLNLTAQTSASQQHQPQGSSISHANNSSITRTVSPATLNPVNTSILTDDYVLPPGATQSNREAMTRLLRGLENVGNQRGMAQTVNNNQHRQVSAITNTTNMTPRGRRHSTPPPHFHPPPFIFRSTHRSANALDLDQESDPGELENEDAYYEEYYPENVPSGNNERNLGYYEQFLPRSSQHAAPNNNNVFQARTGALRISFALAPPSNITRSFNTPRRPEEEYTDRGFDDDEFEMERQEEEVEDEEDNEEGDDNWLNDFDRIGSSRSFVIGLTGNRRSRRPRSGDRRRTGVTHFGTLRSGRVDQTGRGHTCGHFGRQAQSGEGGARTWLAACEAACIGGSLPVRVASIKRLFSLFQTTRSQDSKEPVKDNIITNLQDIMPAAPLLPSTTLRRWSEEILMLEGPYVQNIVSYYKGCLYETLKISYDKRRRAHLAEMIAANNRREQEEKEKEKKEKEKKERESREKLEALEKEAGSKVSNLDTTSLGDASSSSKLKISTGTLASKDDGSGDSSSDSDESAGSGTKVGGDPKLSKMDTDKLTETSGTSLPSEASTSSNIPSTSQTVPQPSIVQSSDQKIESMEVVEEPANVRDITSSHPPSIFPEEPIPYLDQNRLDSVSTGGKEYKIILGDGLDPSFLAALPENLRQEVMSEQIRLKNIEINNDRTSNPNLSDNFQPVKIEVCQSFMTALPANIQQEILTLQTQESQRQTSLAARRRASQSIVNSTTTSPSTNGATSLNNNGGSTADTVNPLGSINSSDFDPALFIHSLPFHLRQQVLSDLDDSVVALLPEELAREARNLQRHVQSRHRRLQQSLFGGQWYRFSNPPATAANQANSTENERSLTNSTNNTGNGNIMLSDGVHAPSSLHFQPPISSRPTSLGITSKALLDTEHLTQLIVLALYKQCHFVENKPFASPLDSGFNDFGSGIDQSAKNSKKVLHQTSVVMGKRIAEVLKEVCRHPLTFAWVLEAVLSLMECPTFSIGKSFGSSDTNDIEITVENDETGSISANECPCPASHNRKDKHHSNCKWLTLALKTGLGSCAGVFKTYHVVFGYMKSPPFLDIILPDRRARNAISRTCLGLLSPLCAHTLGLQLGGQVRRIPNKLATGDGKKKESKDIISKEINKDMKDGTESKETKEQPAKGITFVSCEQFYTIIESSKIKEISPGENSHNLAKNSNFNPSSNAMPRNANIDPVANNYSYSQMSPNFIPSGFGSDVWEALYRLDTGKPEDSCKLLADRSLPRAKLPFPSSSDKSVLQTLTTHLPFVTEWLALNTIYRLFQLGSAPFTCQNSGGSASKTIISNWLRPDKDTVDQTIRIIGSICDTLAKVCKDPNLETALARFKVITRSADAFNAEDLVKVIMARSELDRTVEVGHSYTVDMGLFENAMRKFLTVLITKRLPTQTGQLTEATTLTTKDTTFCSDKGLDILNKALVSMSKISLKLGSSCLPDIPSKETTASTTTINTEVIVFAPLVLKVLAEIVVLSGSQLKDEIEKFSIELNALTLQADKEDSERPSTSSENNPEADPVITEENRLIFKFLSNLDAKKWFSHQDLFLRILKTLETVYRDSTNIYRHINSSNKDNVESEESGGKAWSLFDRQLPDLLSALDPLWDSLSTCLTILEANSNSVPNQTNTNNTNTLNSNAYPSTSNDLDSSEVAGNASNVVAGTSNSAGSDWTSILRPTVEAFFRVHSKYVGYIGVEGGGTRTYASIVRNPRREINPSNIEEEPVASNIQPIATENHVKTGKDSQKSVNQVQEVTNNKRFLDFATSHRQILNRILRQTMLASSHSSSHNHSNTFSSLFNTNNSQRNTAEARLLGPFSILAREPYCHLLDFDIKRRYFRDILETMPVNYNGANGNPLTGHIRNGEDFPVHVRRTQVFEDSYRELHRQPPAVWKNRFYIIFEGEEGQDAGGLLREWYSIIAREIFDPNYALFRISPGDRVTYTINPASHCNSNHLSYFKFVGRVIGKALYDNKHLECYFTRSFYKHILGKSVKYTDMESEDYDFYQGLVYLLENNVETLGYELTFSTQIQEFGVTETRDLKPNGRNVIVTEENKQEYVSLLCQMKMTGAIRQQLNSFLEGFYDVIPKDLISIFNEQELELFISGLPKFDIENLKTNTEYHKYQSDSLQIKWFWRALRSFDPATKAKFLQFVTGTSKVPLQGFGSLEGMNGIQKFQIYRDNRSTDRLPSAHTCFNQLDLPAYENYTKLRSMLLKAILECSEGFGLA